MSTRSVLLAASLLAAGATGGAILKSSYAAVDPDKVIKAEHYPKVNADNVRRACFTWRKDTSQSRGFVLDVSAEYEIASPTNMDTQRPIAAVTLTEQQRKKVLNVLDDAVTPAIAKNAELVAATPVDP